MSRAVLTVSHDPAAVESSLLGRELGCPLCPGALKPWGFGVSRIIRCGAPAENQCVTPRRGRCCDCATTHILLPAQYAARRADEAAVIAHAVELSSAQRLGFRKIAVILERPETTVRDWLRVVKDKATDILAAFATRVHRATAEALGFWPAPADTAGANALGMLMAHARALAHVHQLRAPAAVLNVTWHQGALLAHGPWFFSAVGWPDRLQHQPALPLEG